MMKMSFTFRGAIVPVLTPFNNDSKRTLNLSIIPQYAAFLANKGITGVLVNGTTGEGMSMTVAERKLVAEAWANAVKTTKQHLMIQVGGAALPDVLELAKHAESIKANSILSLPELFFKPTTAEQLADYLKMVSDAAPNTPLLYYHNPMYTHVNVHMGECLESWAQKIPTFVGIKFTSTNLEEGAQAFNAANRKYVVFIGSDQIMNAACAMGMDSIIATSANMFPELVLEILEAGKAGNSFKAREKQEKLTRAVMAISKYGHWVETMKLAMCAMTTIKVGPPRAPLTILRPEIVASMTKDLLNMGYNVTA